MKEIIAVRIVANVGYVCHGQIWESLDDLVLSIRKNWPGCQFRIDDADPDTAAYWQRHATKENIVKKKGSMRDPQ